MQRRLSPYLDLEEPQRDAEMDGMGYLLALLLIAAAGGLVGYARTLSD